MDPELERRFKSSVARSNVLKERAALLMSNRLAAFRAVQDTAAALPAVISRQLQTLPAELDAVQAEAAGLLADTSRGLSTLKVAVGEAARAISVLGEQTARASAELLGTLETSLEQLTEFMIAESEETRDFAAEKLDELVDELNEELLPEAESAFDEGRETVEEEADEVHEQLLEHGESFTRALNSAWDDLDATFRGGIEQLMDSLRQIDDQARSLADQIQQLTETVVNGRNTLDSSVDATNQGAGGAIQVVTDTIDIFREIA